MVKIDNVLNEHVGLLHVLPLAVHLNVPMILVSAQVPLVLIWVLNWVGPRGFGE